MTTDTYIQKIVDQRTLTELLADVELIEFATKKFSSGSVVKTAELRAMFNTYNLYFNKKEYSLFCGACRTKVYKGLVYVLPFIQQKISVSYG